MIRDVLVALRRLAARPTFALAAIGTLALGVGATTAIFSTVNATLLRPLPYREPGDLYAINTRLADGRFTTGSDRIAGAQVYEINATASTVKHVVAYRPAEATLVPENGPPLDIQLVTVSDGFFDLFGLPMAAGRPLVSSDHTGPPMTTPPPTVGVISHRLWDEMFGRDPGIVNRPIRLRSAGGTGPMTIIGVAPPELDVPQGAELWSPFVLPNTIGHTYQGYLRVNAGTTREQLTSELDAIMTRVVEQHPIGTGRIFVIRPLVESIVGDLAPILLVVLAGAVVLLFLGCVNVATLILARGTSQMKEMAVRVALGASRGRILRQFLAEAFVLAAAGLVAGLFLASAGLQLLVGSGAADLPRLQDIPFDRRVLLFAIALLVTSTVLVGLLPAVRLFSTDTQKLLTESGRSASASHATRGVLGGLIVAEIALAIMLVAGAGWLVRSYVNLTERHLGFTATGRLLVEVLLPDTPSVLQQWADEAPQRLRALQQVTAVGSASSLPLRAFYDPGWYVAVPGEPYDPNHQTAALRSAVSEDYFEAMGVRLLAGRGFSEEDRPRPPLVRTDPVTGEAMMVRDPQSPPPRAIINKTFAETYLKGRNPLGATIAWGGPLVNFRQTFEVIGVIDNIQYRSLREPLFPIWYVQQPFTPRRFIVATSLDDPSSLIPSIQGALAQVDPSVVVKAQPFEEILSSALWRHRLGLALMVVFAVVSLGLAAIGIFGVIAHATGQRTRELATRMALGATPRNITTALMSQGRRLSLIGVVVGVAAAYAGGRLAASRLYEVRAGDPTILIVAVIAVMLVTFLAFLVPAIRAARIAPGEALKLE